MGGKGRRIDERTVDDALALLDGAATDADEAVDAARDLARDLVRAEAGEVLACLYTSSCTPRWRALTLRGFDRFNWFGLGVWA